MITVAIRLQCMVVGIVEQTNTEFGFGRDWYLSSHCSGDSLKLAWEQWRDSASAAEVIFQVMLLEQGQLEAAGL